MARPKKYGNLPRDVTSLIYRLLDARNRAAVSSTSRTQRTHVRDVEKDEPYASELRLVRQLCPFVRNAVEYTRVHSRGHKPSIYVLDGAIKIQPFSDRHFKTTTFTVFYKNDNFGRRRHRTNGQPRELEFEEFFLIRVQVTDTGHSHFLFEVYPLQNAQLVKNAQLNARRMPSTVRVYPVDYLGSSRVRTDLPPTTIDVFRNVDPNYHARIKMVLNALMQCGS